MEVKVNSAQAEPAKCKSNKIFWVNSASRDGATSGIFKTLSQHDSLLLALDYDLNKMLSPKTYKDPNQGLQIHMPSGTRWVKEYNINV